ncbi:MAG: hypothetical protein DWH85_02295 [Planctomycetota bacterium]|nr:MAG: hypothetical protein DWH85_02295 [Planctomycetota bacterium]
MDLKKFRTGLLGRFVKFGIVPGVIVIAGVLCVNTYFSLLKFENEASELARKMTLRLTSEIENRNQKALGTISVIRLALETSLITKRAEILQFLKPIAEANPDFGVFVALESTSSQSIPPTTVSAATTSSSSATISAATTDTNIDQATNANGRFAPLYERDVATTATTTRTLGLTSIANIEESNYYIRCKQEFINNKSRKVVVTDPHMHKGEMVYEFVMPIVINGQFMGIAGLQRTLFSSLDLMNQMCVGNKINVMLLTNQDVFIAAMCGDVTANDQARATYSALTGKPLDTTEWANPLRDIVFQKTNEVVSSAVNPLSNANGIHVMGTVRTGGWKVIVEIPGALMFSEMWSDLWVSLVLSIVGIVIMAVLILRTATKVVGEVSEVTVGISNTANMMAGSSRQQESMTQNFGSSSVEIAAAVRQITVTGEELLRNMKKIAQASSESAQNASEGRVGVQAIGSTMENLSSATTNVAERLSMIFEKASSINTIIDTITKVSDQTNLLSVNAAIEAEKAGESGRGFLVVAREIRRLADQTASATLDIEKMVQQMQAAVSGGVMEMDRFSEQVRRGVTTVGDVGLRLTKVIDQVSGVESSFCEVTEGMQQQAQGADQIRQAMDGLTQNASRAQEATSEFSSASESLREAIFSLRKVISGDISV